MEPCFRVRARPPNAMSRSRTLAELHGALLQGARAAAECHEPLAQVIAVTGGAISEPFDHATGPLVRVQHPTVRVEHRDPLTERFQHRLTERRERRLGWETGVLLSR